MPDLGTTAVPIVILMEDDPLHTDIHPFCSSDPHCPCHEDPVLIAQVARLVDDGLLTPAEASSFVAGTLIAWRKENGHDFH